MRLPNFDLTVLAVHYLFAATDGSMRPPVAAPQPRRAPERIHEATALANATRAGLIDRHVLASVHVARHAPTSAHVVRHPSASAHVVRYARASAHIARHAAASARGARHARRHAREAGPAAHAGASRTTLAKWSRAWDTLPACQKAELAQAITAAHSAGADIDAHVAS
ncbi:MAG: hypothetical protein ACRYGL_13435, partial [Janthinobacterium lividum]